MGQGRGGGLLEGRGPWRTGSLRQGKEGYPVSGGQSRGRSRHFGCGGQQVERGRLEPHSDLNAGWGGVKCVLWVLGKKSSQGRSLRRAALQCRQQGCPPDPQHLPRAPPTGQRRGRVWRRRE